MTLEEEDPLIFGEKEEREQLLGTLRGNTLISFQRKGKYIYCRLQSGPFLVFHFGMTGDLRIQGATPLIYQTQRFLLKDLPQPQGQVQDEDDVILDQTPWPPRFTKIILGFEGGVRLAYADQRRLGRVWLSENPEGTPPISKLGFDPLPGMPSLEEFSAGLLKKKIAIKTLLLDQSFSAGVGNYLADEILYHARLHPARKAQSLTPLEVQILHGSIFEIVSQAATLTSKYEKFPPGWLFHVRWDKRLPAHTPEGAIIKFITLGGRTAALVPSVQLLNPYHDWAEFESRRGSIKGGVFAPGGHGEQTNEQGLMKALDEEGGSGGEPRSKKFKEEHEGAGGK